jgi:hypothetical protein
MKLYVPLFGSTQKRQFESRIIVDHIAQGSFEFGGRDMLGVEPS